MNVIIRAAQFACAAHAGQKRKYNGRLYITHPSRIAGRAATLEDATEKLVVAAYLHDVLEDTNRTAAEIGDRFGSEVVRLVLELTNPSKGLDTPRAERKRIDREHLAKASHEAKLLKLLDRIDNLCELEGAPRGFQRLYANESALLLDAIGDAHSELAQELRSCIAEVNASIAAERTME